MLGRMICLVLILGSRSKVLKLGSPLFPILARPMKAQEVSMRGCRPNWNYAAPRRPKVTPASFPGVILISFSGLKLLARPRWFCCSTMGSMPGEGEVERWRNDDDEIRQWRWLRLEKRGVTVVVEGSLMVAAVAGDEPWRRR
ncbi:hypothetical protein Droror1_Dr00009975 [Drosera rotundifolia]